MDKRIIDPEVGKSSHLFDGAGVNQLIHSAGVAVDVGGVRHVYASGKTATNDQSPDPEDWDRLVGIGDIFEQTRQVCRNIRSTLAQAGATLDDVVRVRVYVTEPMTRDDFQRIHEARSEFFSPHSYPASTLVVVSRLARPDALIEIDADAVLPLELAKARQPDT